jgi:hypothetical protein
MDDLDAAIQAIWTTNTTTLAPIVGGISPTLQAPGVARPYVVTFMPPAQGGKLKRAFGSPGNRTVAEPAVIQFSLFAGGRALAKSCGDLIASVFDDAALPLTQGFAIQCVRDRKIVIISDIVGNIDENGQQVYQAILFYNILVSPA